MQMANFYLVEQRGVPGARLIEAERPASAINHVIDGAFSAKRVDGRELLDAAGKYEVEVAGVKPTPEPTSAQEEPEPAASSSEDQGQSTDQAGSANFSDDDEPEFNGHNQDVD